MTQAPTQADQNIDRAKVLERISQLLNMANDVSSPAEAAIAARRARALMDKHQVSMAEIADSEPDEFDSIPQGKAYRFMPAWKSILALAVARYNDCKCDLTNEYYAQQKHYRHRPIFKGYRSDVIVAGAMNEYLVQTIDRLCATYIATNHPEYDKYPARIGDAYKKGAASELCDRLYAMLKERNAAMTTSKGTELMVIKAVAVEAEFGKQRTKTKSLATRDSSDAWAAKRQGREDAKKINLSSQIEQEHRVKVGQ